MFGGSGIDFLRCLDDFSNFLWACFRLLLLGGLRSSDPPALALVSVVLGQVFSQLCQENPRTCSQICRESKNLPRTKPRTKSAQTPTRKIKSQSFVLLNSFPYRNPPYSKNLGGGTPPRGASIRQTTLVSHGRVQDRGRYF